MISPPILTSRSVLILSVLRLTSVVGLGDKVEEDISCKRSTSFVAESLCPKNKTNGDCTNRVFSLSRDADHCRAFYGIDQLLPPQHLQPPEARSA